MAKAQSTDSGLPRREPGRTVEVVGHQHPGLDDPNHKHRLGQIPHTHDEDGRPIVGADVKLTPANTANDDIDPTLVTGNAAVPSPAVVGVGMVKAAKEYEETAAAVAETMRQPAPRVDAAEGVLGVAMGTINPGDADPTIAMRHAEESARVLIVGQHVGNMFQAIAAKQFVANADLRVVYRKVRQMADFHGIDLDEVG